MCVTRHRLRIGAYLASATLLGAVLSIVLSGTAGARAQTGGSGNNLYAVDCSSANFCVAVESAGVILQFRGPAWDAAASGTSNDLYDVACASGTSICFAVGANGTILQYSDSAWSGDASGTGSNLYGVACPSVSVCFAVGANGTLLQYNGSAWSVQRPFPPAPAGSSSDMADVTCPSTSLCFAVGAGGRIFQNNGAGWNAQASNTSNALNGVSCLNASLCFAVGAAGTILQYNGNAWTGQSSGTASALTGVTCLSASLCFAVGAGGTMLQYNGSGWNPVQPSVTTNYLSDIACQSSTATNLCFAVGLNGTLLTYEYGSWSGQQSGASFTTTYQAGWNFIGVPAGTVITGNVGPLYTYQANDTSYEQVPAGMPLQGGAGYWADFASSTKITAAAAPVPASAPFVVPVPASHWIMVGNPSDVPVTLTGVGVAYTYGSSTGYAQAFELNPGQGAWVYSQNGGPLSMQLAPPPATPPV